MLALEWGGKWIVAALVAATAALLLAGCGSTTESEADAVNSATLVQQVADAEAEAELAKAEAEKAKAEAEKAKVESGSEGDEEPEGESKVDRVTEDAEKGQSGSKSTVPDVTGMDHQLAQDTLQAAGFYMLNEVDCSGQDRSLFWDRNWTVEEQKPRAGSKASTDATITLCSVKDGE